MAGATIQNIQGSAEWQFGLFGCFADTKLCVLAFCVPCFVIGKNAEGVGEECLLHGLLACIGVNFGPIVRWRIRQEKNIKGSMLMDGLTYAVCPPCALVQDARELNWAMPEEITNPTGRKEDQNMSRE